MKQVHTYVYLSKLRVFTTIYSLLGTKTKYYLAQCYQHLGEKETAAIYCHLTLKKQLKCRDFLSFFDPIDWAVNAATLGQFFLYRWADRILSSL